MSVDMIRETGNKRQKAEMLGGRCETGGMRHGQDMGDRSQVIGGRPWEI